MNKGILTFLLTLSIGLISAQSPNAKLLSNITGTLEQHDYIGLTKYWNDSITYKNFTLDENKLYVGKSECITHFKETYPKTMDVNFVIREQFQSGNYIVADLFYESSNGKVTEMFTVLRLKNGVIIEQFDFVKTGVNGDLSSMKIALEYIMAYSNKDLQKMSSFYSDNIVFKDLTAKDAFKSSNFELEGIDAVTQLWKGIIIESNTSYINVKVNNSFQAGPFIMLNTTFSMILPGAWTGGTEGVFVNFPIKTILKIEEGKIILHYDFADYNAYAHQIKIQTDA
ncbi:nuclear transport factor 2 family protein [Ekhidna sp. To15]|uniref:nuclear transport factor 2 family protein n=1 Tax=Ekhidna sp. To15 TaxID=3395267 RepID=UPI003F521FBF